MCIKYLELLFPFQLLFHAYVRQCMGGFHFMFHIDFNVSLLTQVLASYMNPGEKWPPEDGDAKLEDGELDEEENHDLPMEFIDLVANSSLVPAICSYLRNDSGIFVVGLLFT